MKSDYPLFKFTAGQCPACFQYTTILVFVNIDVPWLVKKSPVFEIIANGALLRLNIERLQQVGKRLENQ